MGLRDHGHSPDSSSSKRGNKGHASSPVDEEELDTLVRRILSRSLDKFDDSPQSDTDRGRPRRRSEHDTTSEGEERRPARGSQNNELARLVLGHAAQFAVKRYLEHKQQKKNKQQRKSKAAHTDYPNTTTRSPAHHAVKMPFLYGDGGRPLRSGERERMQRRRETGRSSPYDGDNEIHQTADPLPSHEPEPAVPVGLSPRNPDPDPGPGPGPDPGPSPDSGPPSPPKLRRRRRYANLSGRAPVDDDPARPPPPPRVRVPEDNPPLPSSLHRAYTWDSTPAFAAPAEPTRTQNWTRSRYDRPQEPLLPSRSSYSTHHPNYPYPLHDAHYPQPESRRHRTRGETLREYERQREKEKDQDREQRRRDCEYDRERRQRKEMGRERERERERPGEKRERTSGAARSREAALALRIDDLLGHLRSTDDVIYQTMHRPSAGVGTTTAAAGGKDYDDERRCRCRALAMQTADLKRSIARSRSSARAVRDMLMLDAALVEDGDGRKRRRATVRFAGE